MWNWLKSHQEVATPDAAPAEAEPAPAAAGPPASTASALEPRRMPEPVVTRVATIGRQVRIKGDLDSDEPLWIEGRIKGRVQITSGLVGIAAGGEVRGDVVAPTVEVKGRVFGKIVAAERLVIHAGGRVDGEAAAPKVRMVDGAVFRGRLSTRQTDAALRVAEYRQKRRRGVG